MQEKEKRQSPRVKTKLSAFVRKNFPDGKSELMQFLCNNASVNGIFLVCENLTVFDLGEEIEILVDQDGSRYFDGRGRIVRSARIFSDNEKELDSGFGVMFFEGNTELSAMLEKIVKNAESGKT